MPPLFLHSLSRIRQAKFLTQEELALRAGIARSSVAELEACHRPARPPTVRKLAEALDVQPAELLIDDPEE